MLKVGIHDNTKITNVLINDHGTLEVEFTKAGNNNVAGALSGSGELTKDEVINIRSYPQAIEYFGSFRTGKQMVEKILQFRNVLVELLGVYIANPNIDATKGMKLPLEGTEKAFEDQDNVDKAYKNIVTQFVSQMKPFVSGAEFRIKLPRKSAASNFPALPSFGPFVESMDIPAEASKIKWSNWELKNGRNLSTPAVDEVADAATAEEVEKLDEVFATDGKI